MSRFIYEAVIIDIIGSLINGTICRIVSYAVSALLISTTRYPFAFL